MSDPAISQVVAQIAAQITEPGGASIFTDRGDAEPIQPGERPAKVIRVTDVVLDEYMEQGRGAQMHVATIDIDHYEDVDSTDNLNSQLAASVKTTVELIGADDTLGSRVFELTMVSVTANADDVPDVGVAILTLQVKFLTDLYDWSVIRF